jgi:Abnormal spindle-like microcephaly-assoc'd, ASPM-SPD-2-Hydin
LLDQPCQVRLPILRQTALIQEETVRKLAFVFALAIVSNCGGNATPTPTAPTPPAPTPPAPTKIIRLQAILEFGSIPVGTTADRELRIFNDGNAALTVTALAGPSGYTASWTTGTIAPGSSQLSVIRFSPTAASTYNGTVTVQSDATSGSNTTPISGAGLRDIFRRSGSGDTVFDMPLDVSRIHIVGTYPGFSSNFIVKIGGRLIVNELLGTGWGTTRYDGTLLTGGGGTVSITNSSGVSWSFEEVR